MNPDEIADDDIVGVIGSIAAETVPLNGIGTPEEQAIRKRTGPFIAYALARRLQTTIIHLEQKIKEQRDELIETRKELSKLKRTK